MKEYELLCYKYMWCYAMNLLKNYKQQPLLFGK